MNRLVGAAASVALVVLAACSETERKAADAPIATAPSLRELSLGDPSQLGPQYADRPVIANVLLERPTPGSRLTGRLLELRSGRTVASASIELGKEPAAEYPLELRASMDWVPGRYLVELDLDGKMIGQRDIDIVERPKNGAAPSPGR